ncbi:sulfotransferase [Thalassotalea sp. ND16A]|uniref:sulfotransferase n=1 Tax=Thalassotalea sp. ND16A TaxID=1535422 RepID=UPI00051A7A5C|nr:sulfotransferase [Thalassotalea sp. ND16A]
MSENPRTENNKIFIIGLPRTATTSICVAMLDLGFKVAHTCYTEKCLVAAQVIADTPVFYNFVELDKQFPGAKFIYLERELSSWLPSIKQLLLRMHTNVTRSDGGYNPIIRHCYSEVFSPFTEQNINQDSFLERCYLQHKSKVLSHFSDRASDFLMLNIAEQGSYQKLLTFLNIDAAISDFAKINIGGKVTAWNKIKHPNKVESTKNGRIDKHLLSFTDSLIT